MSVFNDFQRLWMERFPQSSLSDAWEQDVRASLDRHRQKISELTKELEQETLYVEYLERLLSDVEKYRESGGDPTTLFEAPATAGVTGIENEIGIGGEGDIEDAFAANTNSDTGEEAAILRKSSLNLREQSSGGGGGGVGGGIGAGGDAKDKGNRLSLNTDNKYASTRLTSTGQNAQKTQSVPPSSMVTSTIATSTTTATATAATTTTTTGRGSEEREDKDAGNEKHGALQQCITELVESRDKKIAGENGGGGGGENISIDRRQEEHRSTKASHFVTVIEVKENNNSNSSNSNKLSGERDNTKMSITAGDPGGGSGVVGGNGGDETATVSSTFSSFERRSGGGGTALTSPSMSASSYAAHLEAKKKMPPRPPPKLANIRRVEPPTIPGGAMLSSSPKRDHPVGQINTNTTSDSPGSSLERNIKPSDILRQRNVGDSPETATKSFVANRKTTPELSKFTPEIMEEFGRKMSGAGTGGGANNKIEITDRSGTKPSKSPTGSLGRSGSAAATTSTGLNANNGATTHTGISPTGSLLKATRLPIADSSSTGSLEKKPSLRSGNAPTATLQPIEGENTRTGGSKESLSSQGVSDIIKSYESVSSLNSDSAKATTTAATTLAASSAIGSGDGEPYYDTVALDNGDGEYVYIKPGGNGSSSSRDDLSTPGSTLVPSGSGGSGPSIHLSSQMSVTDPESPGRSSNYANIDYFLQQNNETRSSSLDSDGEYDGPPIMRTISHDEQTTSTSTTTTTPGALRKNSGNARGAKIRNILSSIIQSETIYVECLNKMIKYKKAIHATLGTSQPVIKEDEERAIFFKIDDLYAMHTAFLVDLKAIASHEGGDVLIGETFKRLADMFVVYSAFLHNYGQAIETVKKCSANNPQFKEIVSTIVVNLQTEQSLTLEDLLHKPVARVQINASVFDDLLNETPTNHPDHHPLLRAQKTIHDFLKQFNVVQQHLPNESNRNLRRMVRNSIIVELVDGHRKLRHLFLFNDVLACAKYKASGRERFELELKWLVSLKEVIVYEETADSAADIKESSPANLLHLKWQASTVRDQLMLEEKEEKAAARGGKTNGVRAGDKYRRKLADLESQLVLASPNLVFRVGNKATNKTFTFFLSSDFERTQWIDSILSLKESCNIPGAHNVNALDVHAFIVAMQKARKTEMGSYLMRHTNDESLLVGDLHMGIQNLTGLEQTADVYVCIEIDSYGNFFRKATTKIVCRTTNPVWNENFVLELEGSLNVRILLYEAHDRPRLKSVQIVKLSRSWLTDTPTPQAIKLSETLILNVTFRFVPAEVTLCRVPTSKAGALFGAKMNQVLKREKRDIPFIISACIREVERRGMSEVGVYRVSGSASDLAKLKKSFETNPYEAEQLLKDVDIHSVTGILKSYLRELPEALFSDSLYPQFFDTFSTFSTNESIRIVELLKVFEELPHANKASINHILDHLIRVHHQETDNKMSLHNLAMVFGPTLLRPGQTQTKQKDQLASSTVDVMAQAGILYSFLQARKKDKN